MNNTTATCFWDFTTRNEARYFARCIEQHTATTIDPVTVTYAGESATLYRVTADAAQLTDYQVAIMDYNAKIDGLNHALNLARS